MTSARLRRAFGATRYEAGPVAAGVGRRSRSGDAWLARHAVRHAAFLGAANPLGRKRPPGWNRRMTTALLQRLGRVPHETGQGRGRGWAEPHVLAALPLARAQTLARRFRQAAIVSLARGRPARLRFLAPARPDAP